MKIQQARQRKEVAGALRDVAASMRSLGQDAAASRLLERAEHLEQGGLKVNFIGDIGRGKTTLINALLHENGVLPPSITLVEAPPTEIGDADAIVMLLPVSPLLTQTDVEVITAQRHRIETSKVEHIFFVVNDFGTLTAEEKKQVLEEIAPRRLGPLFGNDTDLFLQRVFFINVQAALEARRSGVDGAVLEETGLPPFERALQNMVTTPEGTRIAMQAVMNGHLVPVIGEARERIQNQKAALDAKSNALDTELSDQEHLLDTLASKKQGLQDDFEAFTQEISQKIVAWSHDYTTERLKAWDGTWQKASDHINLSMGRIVSAFFSKQKKKELAHEVAKVSEAFLEETFETLPELLVENLHSEIETFTAEFEKEMRDLAPNLVDVNPQTIPKISGDAGLLNSNQILRAFKNEDLKLTFGRMTILGSLPLIAFLFVKQVDNTRNALLTLSIVILFEAFFIVRFNSKAISETLKSQLGKVLADNFAAYNAGLQEKADQVVGAQLKLFSNELLKVLDTKIEAAKVDVKETGAQRQAELAAVDEKKAAFDTIRTRIDEGFDAISQRVYGRVFTPEEQQEWFVAAASEPK